MKRSVLTCLSLLLIPVAWQLLSWQMAQPQLIPSFPDLLRALLRLVYTPGFLISMGTTLLRAFVGLLVSLVFASITAFLMNRSEAIRFLFMPCLSLLRSVPVISFILLALIFLNPEMIPLLIAFLTMYPLLTENLLKGLMNRRDSWKMLARQFHLNAWNRLFQINYPQLKPYLFSGLASAVGFGWRAIIMGEVLSQCVDGIGKRMKEAQVFIDVPELIAWTLVAIVLSWLTDKLIFRLSDWQPSVRYRHSAVELQTVSLQPNDICLTDVSYSYGVHHMNIILKAGKIYALSAPSGQGKTTLLQLLNGTLRPISGEISCLPGQTANLFQEPTLLPQLTAKENDGKGEYHAWWHCLLRSGNLGTAITPAAGSFSVGKAGRDVSGSLELRATATGCLGTGVDVPGRIAVAGRTFQWSGCRVAAVGCPFPGGMAAGKTGDCCFLVASCR